jgi:predicted DNA-binding transcriptional regulator AlpA
MNNVKKLYLTESEASSRYGYSRAWFQRERWKGTGPKYIKLNNGRILYPLDSIDNWFSSFCNDEGKNV